MEKKTDPKMHTAEHVLNQSMIRLFGTDRCFSAHIEKKKSKCDYIYNKNLTESDLVKLELTINDIIEKDLPVTEEYLDIKTAGNKFNLKRLPDDINGNIRIINIGDYDSCPCSGCHVNSTKELVNFKIISSSYDSGVLRIRYKLPV